MEGRAHAQRDACHLEEVTPDVPSKQYVVIADNGRAKLVEPDDTVEESSSNGGDRVGMAKRNKMRVLGEAIDHRENDRLTTNLWEVLNEVHGDIRPHLGRHLQRL